MLLLANISLLMLVLGQLTGIVGVVGCREQPYAAAPQEVRTHSQRKPQESRWQQFSAPNPPYSILIPAKPEVFETGDYYHFFCQPDGHNVSTSAELTHRLSRRSESTEATPCEN